jgi:Secretion system C-terminal sorting domain
MSSNRMFYLQIIYIFLSKRPNKYLSVILKQAGIIILFISVLLLGFGTLFAGYDVGAVEVLEPWDSVVGRLPIQPCIRIYNFGSYRINGIPVYCRIDTSGVIIHQSSHTTTLPLWPGRYTDVSLFPEWYPPPGIFTCNITAFTALPGDSNPANDTVRATTIMMPGYVSDFLCSEGPGEPIIDGCIGTWVGGEWSPYNIYDISDLLGRTGTPRPPGSCVLYLEHTGEYVYFGVDAGFLKGRQDYDRVIIKMDENCDSTITPPNEGTHTIFVRNGIDSVVYSYLPGQQCPGCISVSDTIRGNLQFEIGIPIGDSIGDFSIQPNWDAGLAISLWRGDSCYGWWSHNMFYSQWDSAQYYGLYHLIMMGATENNSDASAVPAFTAYPNPCHGVIYIFPNSLNGKSSFSSENKLQELFLFDVLGQKVARLFPGMNDVRNLCQGIYFIRQKTNPIIKKLIITE